MIDPAFTWLGQFWPAAAIALASAASFFLGYRASATRFRREVARDASTPRIFMSYRRADSSHETAELYRRLAAFVGEDNLFRDIDMQAGKDFPRLLDRTMRACQVVVLMIGPEWTGTRMHSLERRIDDNQDWVRAELRKALQTGVRILPVLVRGASMPVASDLPRELRKLVRFHAISVFDEDFQAAAREIAGAIGLDGRGSIAHRMREEHDNIIALHATNFWTGLTQAYQAFATQKKLNVSMQEFFLAAGSPPGLDRGIDPVTYDLPPNRADLNRVWEFARRCYPVSAKGSREALIVQTIVPEAHFSAFNDARSRFCGFWDSWASQRNVAAVALEYSGDVVLIIANTWLDITHRQWTGEEHKPKPGLARLCTEAADLNRRLTQMGKVAGSTGSESTLLGEGG